MSEEKQPDGPGLQTQFDVHTDSTILVATMESGNLGRRPGRRPQPFVHK
jgi:hypothetical protein